MNHGLGASLLPPLGIRLIDSLPPAIRISAPPERIRSAASAMDCNPELQQRLMVSPGTESGRPARKTTARPILFPDSASGIAQPRLTASTPLGATCGYFSTIPRIPSPPLFSAP